MDEKQSDTLLARLGEQLDAQPDIVIAIAFGAAASRRLSPDSDVDVAVLANSHLFASRLRELIELLALQGKRLMCRNSRAFAALVTRTLLDTADFLPYRERMLRERRAS